MTHIDQAGFAPPAARTLGEERRTLALAELIATIGLFLGTAIAAIVVSAGIARAASGEVVVRDGTFIHVLLFGLLVIGLLSLFYPPRRKRRL